MTTDEHIKQAIHHSDRVTSVAERDIIPGVIHAILAVATAIQEHTSLNITFEVEEEEGLKRDLSKVPLDRSQD